MATYTLFKWNV